MAFFPASALRGQQGNFEALTFPVCDSFISLLAPTGKHHHYDDEIGLSVGFPSIARIRGFLAFSEV